MPFSVACDACGATFKLPEEIYERRVAGRKVSLKCKKCKASITVDGTKPRTDLPEQGGTEAESDESASPAPAAAAATPEAQPTPSIADAPEPAPPAVPGTEPGARRPLFSEGPAADWEIPESLRPPKPDPLPQVSVPIGGVPPPPPLNLSPPPPVAEPSPPAPEVAPARPAPPVATPAPATTTSNGQTHESKARPAQAVLSRAAPRAKLESSPQTPRAKQESAPLGARAKQESSPQFARARQESTPQVARAKEATPPTPRVKLESAPGLARAKADAAPLTPRVKLEPMPGLARPKQESSPQVPRAKQESAPTLPRSKQESSPQVPRAKHESAARAKQESSPQVSRLKAQASVARPKLDSAPQAGSALKGKPSSQKQGTPAPAPAAKMPPAKPARSPLGGLRAAPIWEPEDDALTVPMPPVEESPTRPLPPVMSRTPTLPGIPGTFRVGEPGTPTADNLWAVSYADDDDRELTTDELLEELRAGVLDAETLVWRQNMPDWCALGDVPELARHLPWKREQPPKGAGFQVAEPERGLLYPTAYYPPPPEEEEDDKTAVFAYDAALLAAATSEYPAGPAKPAAMPPMPPPPPMPTAVQPMAAPPPPPVAEAIGAWPPPAAPALAPPAAAAAAPAQPAGGRASPLPPKFKRRGGALAVMALLVVAGLAGLAWILIRSSKPPVVASGPERKVETPRAILPPEDKVEEKKPKPAIDPYAVPATSASAAAPAGSAAGDFFELFASGVQSSGTSQQDFDKTRAEKALSALAARAANCRKTGDPPGTASVVVRFDPNGYIGDVRVIGKPYADTPTARCIITRFLGARLQPFKGEPQTLVKNFMLY